MRTISEMLCSIGLHRWEYSKRSARLVYHFRQCTACGKQQVNHWAPLADHKWHPLEDTTMEWERRDMERALCGPNERG